MMCMAACLFVFSLGSLLVKRDSGSFEPTTGSCAANRPAPITKAASPRAMSIRGFFTFYLHSKDLLHKLNVFFGVPAFLIPGGPRILTGPTPCGRLSFFEDDGSSLLTFSSHQE